MKNAFSGGGFKMAYLISEEAQDLLQDVKNFCEKEVVEQCKAYDVSGEWPKEIYDKAIEQGYQALEVPEEYGGPGQHSSSRWQLRMLDLQLPFPPADLA